MDNPYCRVLLVEDTLISKKVIVMTFDLLNCQLDVADTGAQAIEFVSRHTYDFILMDLGLPDFDGFTVTKAIRAMGQRGKEIPIFALTAHATDHDQQQSVQVGMDDYFVKPLTIEQARSLVNRCTLQMSSVEA